MKIFLPLLEQISYFQPSTRCHGNSEQLKLFDLEKSTGEKVAGILERYLSDLLDLKRLGAEKNTSHVIVMFLGCQSNSCVSLISQVSQLHI